MANLNQCTFAVTGTTHQEQYWRTCYDCFTDPNSGACLNCASICHEGHRMGPVKSGNFFCDCGDQRKCKFGQFKGVSVSNSTSAIQLSEQANTLTEKLFNQLSLNRVFSPMSIAYALSLVHLGADGKTDAELTQLFGGKYTINELKQLYAVFNNDVVKMSNCLAVNKSQQLNPEYLQLLGNVAMVANTEFNDELVKKLNNFIEQNTNGLIKDVIKFIDPCSLAILINTIYFKANWQYPFDKQLTEKAEFTNMTGKTQVDMMFRKRKFAYFEDTNMKMIELPYVGNEYCMGIFLPKQVGSIPVMDIENLNANIQKLKQEDVNVFLPKFTHRKNVNLVTPLKQLGVKDLFTPHANLNKIANGAYVTDIIHEAVVIVDEEGTEAAATTVMMMSKGFTVNKVYVFKADHSFIYYIRHKPTNTILFIGDYHGMN